MSLSKIYTQYWNPKLFAVSYFSVYWTDGAVRSLMIFLPLYLYTLQVSPFDVAFILIISYIAWHFKFLIGLLLDISPAIGTWRRRPWIIAGRLMSIFSAIWLIFARDVWLEILPAVLIIMTGDAILDAAADALVLDIAPPDWHGFGLGSGWAGRAIGYVTSAILTSYVILNFGWQAAFLLYSIYSLPAFVVVLIKEPPITKETKFSKHALALTFSDKRIFALIVFAFIGCMIYGLDPNRGILSQIICSYLRIETKTPEEEIMLIIGYVGFIIAAFGIGVAVASLILGRLSDKIGHKKAYIMSLIGGILVILAWAILPPETIGTLFNIIGNPKVSGLVFLSFILGLFEGWNFVMWETILADTVPPEMTAFMFQYFMSGVHASALIVGLVVGLMLDAGFSATIILTVIALMCLIGGGSVLLVKPLKTSKVMRV